MRKEESPGDLKLAVRTLRIAALKSLGRDAEIAALEPLDGVSFNIPLEKSTQGSSKRPTKT